MIDIHSHILPNIDDGSKNIDETLCLIKEAKKAGFEAVVTTPHYMEGYYETNEHEREVWMNLICQKLKDDDLSIKLYLGSEIYMSDNLIQQLKEKKASTLNYTSYVLFDLPFNVEPMNLYNTIYEMQKQKIVPILAHPERYAYIQKELETAYELIEKGVLMQANYGSIIGQYGKKAQYTVRKLLENNMIHLLGSDVHKKETIYSKMPQILNELDKIVRTRKS